MRPDEIQTIGVYLTDVAGFIETLLVSGTTGLVDIRLRRAVRGPRYAFANARRLEANVVGAGIAYVAERRLAPTRDLLAVQHAHVRAHGTALAPAFVERYRRDVVGPLPASVADDIVARAGTRPALLCVERDARHCHRSLAAEWLHGITGSPVRHLQPPLVDA